MRVKVMVSGSSGKVVDAKPSSAPNLDIGACVAKTVKRYARFPQFKDSKQEFSVAFKL